MSWAIVSPTPEDWTGQTAFLLTEDGQHLLTEDGPDLMVDGPQAPADPWSQATPTPEVWTAA